MIRIGILGDIGSGKSYIAKNFGYPVFNADIEVGKLYKKDLKVFRKLKKVLPKYFNTFPINKTEVSKAILANNQNLIKIIKIVHHEIRKKLRIFLKKNKIQVYKIDKFKLNGDFIESQTFAYLAVRSLKKLHLSTPFTTGVSKSISGGKLFF